MSRRELGRVEVLARVQSEELRLLDAAMLLRVSYRQAKQLWRRYREEGAAGLKHRSAGQRSNRAYAPRLQRKVLGLMRKKYGGLVDERFGPTLAAEHMAAKDGIELDAETLRRWCSWKACGAGNGGDGDIVSGGSVKSTSENWCRWTEAFMPGGSAV